MVNVSNVNTQHREVINLVWRVCRIDGRVTNVEENKKKKNFQEECVIKALSLMEREEK